MVRIDIYPRVHVHPRM